MGNQEVLSQLTRIYYDLVSQCSMGFLSRGTSSLRKEAVVDDGVVVATLSKRIECLDGSHLRKEAASAHGRSQPMLHCVTAPCSYSARELKYENYG